MLDLEVLVVLELALVPAQEPAVVAATVLVAPAAGSVALAAAMGMPGHQRVHARPKQMASHRGMVMIVTICSVMPPPLVSSKPAWKR